MLHLRPHVLLGHVDVGDGAVQEIQARLDS
jgi:hypothetical protein